MQELNTKSMELREKDFANVEVSESIMSRYKGRRHPEFEKRKHSENVQARHNRDPLYGRVKLENMFKRALTSKVHN